ncbi:ABC transporter permease [Phenylobacterium sp.]|jgi:putative ABC transport system permease protein|uniref:ABC transporter permease n=1 Tax=Phenylobacterium sp. TaxID=1871053 RepID=UPI0037C7687F
MTDFDLVRKNLFRKPLRTILLTVSIFMAFLIFGMLTSLNVALNRASESGSSAERLVVSNKINFTQPLPIAYVNRIAAIPGVTGVTHSSWFGAYYQDQRNSRFVGFAVDPATYMTLYANDIRLTDAERKAFIAERTGVIVGKSIADQYGWTVGQTVPISSNIYVKPDGRRSWDMKITGIFTGAKPTDSTAALYFHYDYLNETNTFGRDQIGNVAVRTASSDLNNQVAKAIDAAFANSPYETSTVDEKTFAQAFLKQAGDLNFIVTMVVSAAFAAILMIVSTTLVSAMRERTKEIGVMKTLGFSSPRVLRMVLGEALLLSTMGAVLGLVVSAFILAGLSKSPAASTFGDLSMAPVVAVSGLLLAITLGLVTGAIPAASALRMSIVDALNRR